MTIFDLERDLPNGFHDSELRGLRIDYPARSLEMTVDVHVGLVDAAPDEREMYRSGTLSIAGLQYCAIDVPDPGYPYAEPDAVTIDLVEATEFVPPGASFACRFWVNDWNAFIHVAAQAAEFRWTGEPVNRSGA